MNKNPNAHILLPNGKTLEESEQELLDQVVYLGMTKRTLQEAFQRVENKENWKLPIQTRIAVTEISPAELNTISAAVAFFAGSETKVVRRDGWYEITAPGYYRSVGA